MRKDILIIFIRQFWTTTFKNKPVWFLLALFYLLVLYAAYSGYQQYISQNEIRTSFQQTARESWEDNPDKHPHRMAHFGSFAFRIKHKLSMFDFGMESFAGNAVFLEAHKQNTINFSEAGFSTGLLRFGELSMSLLLQVLLPLILFFLGFATVAAEKENGTLKILISQGAGWKEILMGKSLGLFGVSLLFYAPVLIATGVQISVTKTIVDGGDVYLRFILLAAGYAVFLWVLSSLTVCISALSRHTKDALLKLLGVWLLMVILVPKMAQAVGSYLFPTPGKVQFETAVEKDLMKAGDSHNPDDPHFRHIKDSLLKAYNIDSLQQLPFNYGGFLNMRGEQISSEIYNSHMRRLHRTYQQQNNASVAAAFINPVNAIKEISMNMSGSDFRSYLHFQQQAEDYRYQLAQAMNGLQRDHIPNKPQAAGDPPYTVSSKHWEALPDFNYSFPAAEKAITGSTMSFLALLLWLSLSVWLLFFTSKKAKTI